MRICEYCEVKVDNPQIELFYQLGLHWRTVDKEMLQQKLDWYKPKTRGLKETVEVTKEAKELDKATQDRECLSLQRHKSVVREEREYYD